MGRITTQRIIKEYEYLENGLSYMKLYDDVQVKEFREQLSSEMEGISKLEGILKHNGVSQFKLYFDKDGHISYPKLLQ